MRAVLAFNKLFVRIGLAGLLFWPASPALAARFTIDAGQTLRRADETCHCLNTPLWDDRLTDTASTAAWVDLGVKVMRWPGGSNSDGFDFSAPAQYSGQILTPAFAKMAASAGAQSYIILNYGSGSPAMAAAFVAYLNGSASDPTVLGMGMRPTGYGSGWVNFNWQTAGYWASLRGQAPLAVNDGFNLLRASHPAPWGFKYFEIGNETFGSWELDLRPAGQQQSPWAYAQFAAQTASLCRQVDPSIKLGIVAVSSESASYRGANSAAYPSIVNPVTLQSHSGWTPLMLSAVAATGFVPDFIVNHHYPEDPGGEDDATLLADSALPASALTGGGIPLSWAGEAAMLRRLLTQYTGSYQSASLAAGIEIHATEHNSVSTSPGKQSLSLVNGLFVADSFGAVLQTEIKGFCFWATRNGAYLSNNNASSLYGWRQYGDYGVFGRNWMSAPGPLPPGYAPNTPYPNYFAMKLAALFIDPGDAVVAASSDDPLVTVYAAKRADGRLSLLMVNKSPTVAKSMDVQVAGFSSGGTAWSYRYGVDQDNAQSLGSAAALAIEQVWDLKPAFKVQLPAYSMSVLVVDDSLHAGARPNAVGVTDAYMVPSPYRGGKAQLAFHTDKPLASLDLGIYSTGMARVAAAQAAAPSGYFPVGWNAVDVGGIEALANGVYFVKIGADKKQRLAKWMVLK